ncbi:unnamed protein product [Moneuplotes crassus]|uniref:Uncharacterized protein n=1 Tax=Euplotes crassus TaxID=5936 RepID=A0AAD2DBS1_EUPCR|nr:unnamed protein product [Moneuplotes crassus]
MLIKRTLQFTNQTLTFNFTGLPETTTEVHNKENVSDTVWFKFPDDTTQEPDIIPQGLHFIDNEYLKINQTFPFQFQTHLSLEMWIFVTEFNHSSYIAINAQRVDPDGSKPNYTIKIGFSQSKSSPVPHL